MDDGDTGPGAEYDVYPKEFTPVYDARRKLVGKQLYTLLGVPRGDAAGMLKQFRKNYDFFDAPVGMILCVERRMGNGQWIAEAVQPAGSFQRRWVGKPVPGLSQ